MTEREPDDRERGERTLSCAACGRSHRAGDRFCPECGGPLPAPSPGPERELMTETAPDTTPVRLNAEGPAPHPALPETTKEATENEDQTQDRENAAWLLGARPATVIAGGLLLLLLAAALLAIGQRDDTGTIVMLSICTAPLGLLTLAIGIARSIASASRRG